MDLTGAVLDRAYLADAVLAGAVVDDAILTGAVLTRAYLTGAVLDRADLGGADLGGAILTDARWPEGVRVPVGWMVDGDSGRLKRAGGLSEVTVGFDLLSGGLTACGFQLPSP
jgi:Pentapeptide repeats (8 copies)